MAVVRVDQGHERPRVDEDQERFRLRLRLTRSFRNRSPVRSERSGGPPRTDPMTPRKASWRGLAVRDRGRRRAANLTASRTISDFVDPRSRARFSSSLSVSASIRTLIVISQLRNTQCITERPDVEMPFDVFRRLAIHPSSSPSSLGLRTAAFFVSSLAARGAGLPQSRIPPWSSRQLGIEQSSGETDGSSREKGSPDRRWSPERARQPDPL